MDLGLYDAYDKYQATFSNRLVSHKYKGLVPQNVSNLSSFAIVCIQLWKLPFNDWSFKTYRLVYHETCLPGNRPSSPANTVHLLRRPPFIFSSNQKTTNHFAGNFSASTHFSVKTPLLSSPSNLSPLLHHIRTLLLLSHHFDENPHPLDRLICRRWMSGRRRWTNQK